MVGCASLSDEQNSSCDTVAPPRGPSPELASRVAARGSVERLYGGALRLPRACTQEDPKQRRGSKSAGGELVRVDNESRLLQVRSHAPFLVSAWI